MVNTACADIPRKSINLYILSVIIKKKNGS